MVGFVDEMVAWVGMGKRKDASCTRLGIQFSVCRMSCQKRSIIFFEKGY